MATSFDRSVRVRLVFAFFLISMIAVSVARKSYGLDQDQQKPTTASRESAKTNDPAFTEYGGVLSIDFTGRNNGAPTALHVLNEDVASRADGSMYRMKQYANAVLGFIQSDQR